MTEFLDFPVPVIGFAARSGTGKTTLLRQVISILVQRGIRVAVIKHSHHDFEIDKPGKDSYELHHAGSCQTLLTSSYRSVLISENRQRQEPRISEALASLDTRSIDLVLVEGFRDEPDLRKIEIYRASLARQPLYRQTPGIIAVATDQALPDCELPLLDLNTPSQLADFIQQTF